ncbi:MAG TPA: glycerol-3-phosphate dehydrogenase, partial [Solirubrobacteraceae bacterium]|nr:glycerol-3-phosphate dehydrogenase [Solirubrobacteraceae bacterium]
VVAQTSRNRRAGELLAAGMPAQAVGETVGQTVEAFDTLPLLAAALLADRVPSTAVDGLARVVTGEQATDAWLRTVTTGRPRAAA